MFIFFFTFITLGGTMYIDAGGDPTFFNNCMLFSKMYFGQIGYVWYAMYILLFIVMIRSICISILTGKVLKKEIRTNIDVPI